MLVVCSCWELRPKKKVTHTNHSLTQTNKHERLGAAPLVSPTCCGTGRRRSSASAPRHTSSAGTPRSAPTWRSAPLTARPEPSGMRQTRACFASASTRSWAWYVRFPVRARQKPKRTTATAIIEKRAAITQLMCMNLNSGAYFLLFLRDLVWSLVLTENSSFAVGPSSSTRAVRRGPCTYGRPRSACTAWRLRTTAA